MVKKVILLILILSISFSLFTGCFCCNLSKLWTDNHDDDHEDKEEKKHDKEKEKKHDSDDDSSFLEIKEDLLYVARSRNIITEFQFEYV